MQASSDNFQFIITGKANATPTDLGSDIKVCEYACSFYRQHATF